MEKKTLGERIREIWKRIRESWENIKDRLQHNVVTGVNGRGNPMGIFGVDIPEDRSFPQLLKKEKMSVGDKGILLDAWKLLPDEHGSTSKSPRKPNLFTTESPKRENGEKVPDHRQDRVSPRNKDGIDFVD